MTPSAQHITAMQELVAGVFKGLRGDLLGAYGNIEHTRKDDFSPVTKWDVTVEKSLRSALQAKFPDIGFEGEETGSTGSRTTYWLVDPIDGTSSFIRGLPYSTNMAALVHEGHALAAVIYDFVNDVLYTAIKGGGAFKDGQPIHINTVRQAPDLVAYSFTRRQFGLIQEALREVGIRALLTMGATGHSFAMLAEGKIDGIVSLNIRMGAYDIAPGMLLAEEAGAVVSSYDEAEGIERREFIIGSPVFVELIDRSGLI